MKKLLLLLVIILLSVVANADESGTFGENLIWNYIEATKTLTISGSGKMTGYFEAAKYPWHQYRKDINNIIIEEGVTTISYSAFSDCTSLISVSIPQSVIIIGDEAFKNCTSLASISLPLNLTEIGNFAFMNCNSLEYISIPGSVRYIQVSAFIDCNLSTIRFEDGALPLNFGQTLGYNPFTQFSIKEMYLGRDIRSLDFYSKTPYNLTISKTVLNIQGFYRNQIKTLTIEEGSDTLNSSYNSIISSPPFKNATIDSIYLGRVIVGKETRYNSSVKTFANTSSSFSMRIGRNITEIGDDACSDWKIDTIYIPKNVKKIGSSPFKGCEYLHDIFIEDGDDTLEFSEGIGFNGIQLKNLYLGRNVSYPENKSPFSRNKEALTNLTIGNHVTEIGDGQFVGCKNLTRLDFPESLKRIGKQAFYGCEGLTTLNIPTNIAEIGKDAFNLCTGLTSVVIEDSEEPLTIDNNFMNGELKNVYLGRNISYPENFSPFSGLDYLTSLTLGKNVSIIGNRAFADCRSLKDVTSYAKSVPKTGEYIFTESYLPDATLNVPLSLYKEYKAKIPWSLFGRIQNFEGKYSLTYIVDGSIYKEIMYDYGAVIIPEAEPTKEGHTFSGWSEIPETMPDHDVVITGTFTVNTKKGDVNGDDVVDIADAVCIVNHVVGKATPTFIETAADVNSDGVVDIVDAIKIVNNLVGNTPQ